LPMKPARPPGHDREAIVACLSVLTSAIASENSLPASLLAPRAALERVARELPASEEGVARALDASAWRAGLIAGPLFELLYGRTALSVRGAERGTPHVERVTVSE